MSANCRLACGRRPWRQLRHASTPLLITGCGRRAFQTASLPRNDIPDYAFTFDIDGVLVRSSTPISGAREALSYLQKERIPFILLTNGGGKTEQDKIADLQDKLGVPLSANIVIQSHTPYAALTEYFDKNVLIVGGDYDKCRGVAQQYGFKNAITPGDIVVANPDIWPFVSVFLNYYSKFAKPLPKPIKGSSLADSLKIDAIFVYNDPRDWGLDSTIILDALLSKEGHIGTLSPKNGDASLPNRGYQQDGQPPLFYSNPDLWWAASYHLNRLGQGGFQAAFEGLWAKVTGGVPLQKTIIGKPHQPTYEFAERRLRHLRKSLFGQIGLNDPLRRVYMIGDNPESDIRGAKGYKSPYGSHWTSVLVETGVFRSGTQPSCTPDIIVSDVEGAVRWAVEDARKRKTEF